MLDLFLGAQPGVNSPGFYPGKEFSAADCFIRSRYKGQYKGDSLRSNHIMHGQRFWRVISLDDQQNKQIFNTSRGCAQVSLFEVMKFGLLELSLNAFDSDDFNEAAKTVLKQEEKYQRLRFRDSSEVVTFDEKGDEKKELQVVNRYYMGSDVKSFLLKEDWVMNSATGKTEMHIIGIAPLVEEKKTGTVVPLFWLYYPEWKELLGSFMAQSVFDDEPRPYSQIFGMRKFVSQISKENNVYGRSIRSVHHGEEIKQKADESLKKMNNKDSDHFSH